MSAAARSLTSLAIALVTGLTACSGQGTELKDLVNATPDGGAAPVDGGTTRPPSTPYTDPFAGAPAYTTPKPGDTAHNAGTACMDCHANQGPKLLIGGTIYKDYKGTMPAVGVEIRIADTSGRTASAYSGTNGTFYVRADSTTVAFPAVVGARDATSTRPMITQLTGAMGSCGQASCHQANDYGPIHIP